MHFHLLNLLNSYLLSADRHDNWPTFGILTHDMFDVENMFLKINICREMEGFGLSALKLLQPWCVASRRFSSRRIVSLKASLHSSSTQPTHRVESIIL